MKVALRWQRPRPWMLGVVGVLGVVCAAFNLTALTVVAAVLSVGWYVAGVRVEVRGGGFRPLRMVDLIEFASSDQLDAWDREQARR